MNLRTKIVTLALSATLLATSAAGAFAHPFPIYPIGHGPVLHGPIFPIGHGPVFHPYPGAYPYPVWRPYGGYPSDWWWLHHHPHHHHPFSPL